MESAHAVQVVTVDDAHSYHLNETELEKILMREGIKDLPVAVVSVVGAYRGGKSFLLNFFLRYLCSSPSARSDGSWMGEGGKELTGFSWRGGSERNTTGILMWSEPFVVTLPTEEKVAVLLMDTQGTFDSTSTIRDCSTIFALSSLLSSTQIYNLKSNITEEDLQNLQLFTDYGKLIKDQSEKAFQMLEFLIRDWLNPWEYAYGQAGGELYLATKFKTDSNQPLELRELRQHIQASFEKVTCFLMPHPGLGVANPNFKGKPSEISQEFADMLKELATSIFSPDKLCMKRISGQSVKSRELFSYFKTYMTIFNSDEIPTPMVLLQATSKAGLLMAANQVREQFEKNMELACGMGAPSMPATVVSELNQQELAAARATFKAKKLLGDQQDIDKELEELMQELTNRQNEFIEINRSKTLKAIENGKTAYDKAIEDVKKDTLLCVHALDLKQIHDDAVAAALRVFNENRKSGHDGQDADRDKFSKDLTEKYAALNQMNDQNNRVMAAELKQEYSEYIMRKINNVPNLCDNTFAGEHQKARKKALEEFESRRTLHNSYNEDVYKTNMLQAIDRQYLQASQLNASANKELFKTALIVFNENSLKLRDLRKYCLHRHALRREHNSTKEITLNMISPKQLCGDSNRILLEMMENHYEEMKAINDSANEQAVTSAYWAYQSKYDSLSSHWYWAFTSWDTAWEYHQEALGVAFDRFFERRRGGRTYSDGYDVFLNNLEEKCKWYYRNS